MPGAPFYKVFIDKTDEDITSKISRFNHEDAVDVDNLLTLNFFVKTVADLDNPDLKEGSLLRFQYGFVAGRVSPIYVARVMNIKPGYKDFISLTIEAGDCGVIMKKQQSKQDWGGKTSSQIARAIAEANGLKAVVDTTTKVHQFMPQGGLTDYQFMKKLAEMEADGSYRFYLRSDELHFTRLKLDKPSVKTFTYADPNGEVVSFYPYSKEIVKSGASRNTVITTVDPFTNKPVQNVVNNANAKDNTKLDDYSIYFNQNGEEIVTLTDKDNKKGIMRSGNSKASVGSVQIRQQSEDVAGKHITRPVTDVDHALNVANWEKKNKALFDYEAVLTIEGNPDVVSDQVCTMDGVAVRDTGNWYIFRVDHAITGESGYETRLTMGKNGIKKPLVGTEKAADVNKTVGQDKTDKKKQIGFTIFDQDANVVGQTTVPQ